MGKWRQQERGTQGVREGKGFLSTAQRAVLIDFTLMAPITATLSHRVHLQSWANINNSQAASSERTELLLAVSE